LMNMRTVWTIFLRHHSCLQRSGIQRQSRMTSNAGQTCMAKTIMWRQKKRWHRGRNTTPSTEFQWPFEMSHSGANFVHNFHSTNILETDSLPFHSCSCSSYVVCSCFWTRIGEYLLQQQQDYDVHEKLWREETKWVKLKITRKKYAFAWFSRKSQWFFLFMSLTFAWRKTNLLHRISGSSSCTNTNTEEMPSSWWEISAKVTSATTRTSGGSFFSKLVNYADNRH
jgi:hypothetical protein